MQKLAILATGLVVLVGFTWTTVATAQVTVQSYRHVGGQL